MFHVSYCNLEFSSYFPEIFFEEAKTVSGVMKRKRSIYLPIFTDKRCREGQIMLVDLLADPLFCVRQALHIPRNGCGTMMTT